MPNEEEGLCNMLEQHHKNRRNDGDVCIEEITAAMNKHFQYIKDITGVSKEVEEPLENVKSNQAFSLLRPESPYKLTQLLSNEFNPKKSIQGSIYLLRVDDIGCGKHFY
jgi:hypothetical protein